MFWICLRVYTVLGNQPMDESILPHQKCLLFIFIIKKLVWKGYKKPCWASSVEKKCFYSRRLFSRDLMCHYAAIYAASVANSWLSYCNNKVTYCAETWDLNVLSSFIMDWRLIMMLVGFAAVWWICWEADYFWDVLDISQWNWWPRP